jgi:hypothetical protein
MHPSTAAFLDDHRIRAELAAAHGRQGGDWSPLPAPSRTARLRAALALRTTRRTVAFG